MMERYVGLFRGINVGRAKRIAMADLRALAGELGYRDVRTVLNSGNLVFSAPAGSADAAAARIQAAVADRLGVKSRVTVLTATELAAAVAGNPLAEVATDPSRLLVAVLADPRDRDLLTPLAQKDWSPERLAIGSRVAYIWCPDGILASRLPEAVGRVLGDAVTMRNWSTSLRLHALCEVAVH